MQQVDENRVHLRDRRTKGVPVSRWWGQPHIKQAVGKNVPKYGTEHKQGIDAEEDPKEGLLLEPLFIVLQDHHPQRETHHHPAQVSYKAGVGARRKGWRVEAEPHRPAKFDTHCICAKNTEKHVLISIKIGIYIYITM